MEYNKEAGFEEERLYVSDAALAHLEVAGRWARTLAIIGYVGLALMVVAGFFAIVATAMFSRRTFGNDFPPALFGLAYWLMAVVYFFPIRYLHQFGIEARIIKERRMPVSIEAAFSSLRQHYQYVGILTIIVLSLYAFFLLFALFALLAAGAGGGFR